MKQINGLWLPDADEHFESQFKVGPMFWGLPTYQFRKFAAIFPHIIEFRHAVDAGAHCGLWTRVLGHIFPQVTAFEPIPEHVECLKLNAPNATVVQAALGQNAGSVRMVRPGKNSGNAAIRDTGDFEAPVATLDSFGLSNVDFLKLDCEGYEHNVVMGGLETIKRDRPAIIVERHKGHLAETGLPGAVQTLERLGMKTIAKLNNDHLMVF